MRYCDAPAPDVVLLCDHDGGRRPSTVRKRVKVAEFRRRVDADGQPWWHVHDPFSLGFDPTTGQRSLGSIDLDDRTCPGVKLYSDDQGTPVGFHPKHAQAVPGSEAMFRLRCGHEVIEKVGGGLQLGMLQEGVPLDPRERRGSGNADKMSARRMAGCNLEISPYPRESQLYALLEELRHVERVEITLSAIAARLSSS